MDGLGATGDVWQHSGIKTLVLTQKISKYLIIGNLMKCKHKIEREVS